MDKLSNANMIKKENPNYVKNEEKMHICILPS